jgi:hypothetical protein
LRRLSLAADKGRVKSLDRKIYERKIAALASAEWSAAMAELLGGEQHDAESVMVELSPDGKSGIGRPEARDMKSANSENVFTIDISFSCE